VQRRRVDPLAVREDDRVARRLQMERVGGERSEARSPSAATSLTCRSAAVIALSPAARHRRAGGRRVRGHLPAHRPDRTQLDARAPGPRDRARRPHRTRSRGRHPKGTKPSCAKPPMGVAVPGMCSPARPEGPTGIHTKALTLTGQARSPYAKEAAGGQRPGFRSCRRGWGSGGRRRRFRLRCGGRGHA